MTITFTITALQETQVLGNTTQDESLSLPLSLFPATCAVGQTYWLQITDNEPQTTTPQEILNELLGNVS